MHQESKWRYRAHHELTHGLIWTRPAGFFFSKSLIWICTDKFPRVICLCGSGTCIPQITCSIQVPTSICRYSQVLADISYHLINCLHIFEILYEHLHSFFVANITTIWVYYHDILPSLQATALVLEDLNYLTFWNKSRDLTPCMQDCWGACWCIQQPMSKFAYSEPTTRESVLNITRRG